MSKSYQSQLRCVLQSSAAAGSLLALGLGFNAATPAAATAQEATGDTIVVTARKREENLQDIPDAVTAIRAEEIETRNITDLGDLSNTIPNFLLRETQQPGTAFIASRGVAMQRFQEPSVAIVIDGVQLVSQYQILQAFYDVEQIEVLRGPQGSLYGRNAIGGAINITTKQPGDEFEGYVKGRYGVGPDYGARASVSGPLVEDKLYFTVLGAYRDFEGVIDNVTTGDEADFEEMAYVRGRLLFNVADNVTLDLRGSHEDREGGVGYFLNIDSGNVNDLSQLPRGGTEGAGERTLTDASVKLEWDLGGATLTGVGAYSKLDDDYLQDVDYEPVAALDGLQFVDVEAFTGELRLTSDSDSALRWLIGAYYADIDQDIQTIIAANPCFFVDPFSCPLGGPVAFPDRVDIPFGNNRNNNETFAVFGQLNYDVAESTELTLGLRYDRDKRTQFDVLLSTTDEETFDAVQPKVSLAHRWSPVALTYATVSRGFRSGAFNGTDFVIRLYDAETLWNYEVGAKLDLFENRLRINSAAFYLDYADRQEYVLQGGTGAQTLFNIPESRIIGVEVESIAYLADGVTAEFNFGFIDSEIKETNDAAELALQMINGLDPSITFEGNELPNIPRVTLNGALQFERSLTPEIDGLLRLSATHRDGLHWSLGNANDEQDAVTLVNINASLTYGFATLSAYAENLFDEEYYAEVALPGFGSINPVPAGFRARGRLAGVELKLAL